MSTPAPALLPPNEGAARGEQQQQQQHPSQQQLHQQQKQAAAAASPKAYKGFVAGIFSGVAKLSVGHPFDTIKVRLQTSPKSRFSGPVDCVQQTLRNEGVRGLYKGATPPLVGWMFIDSLMFGSLTLYRRLLLENVWSHPRFTPAVTSPGQIPPTPSLSPIGHGLAGVMAGCTVSFIAAPVEHVKARLQIQYAAKKTERLYSGPIDCSMKLLKHHGIRGLYHGLGATLIFRSSFFCWWSVYDILNKWFKKNTNLSEPSINFWTGGLSAQCFWLTAYPSDVVKQRLMTDPLGGSLGDGERKFKTWMDAARDVYRKDGVKGYWRGFAPCFLRAFPANAMALVAFEGVMRILPG